MTTVNEIQERNDLFDRIRGALSNSPYYLASLADCAAPDSVGSPGAEFLDNVRTAVLDTVRWQLIDADGMENYGTGSGSDWRQEAIDEISDSAPSVYTHDLWQQFTDLAAYREEDAVTEVYGGWSTDSKLEGIAQLCLRFIAERLALALLDEAHGIWLGAQEDDSDYERCEGFGGTKDPRCGRKIGHDGCCDWTE